MRRFNPPFYFAITLILSFVCHFALPLGLWISGSWRWLGLILILAGGWITVWADAIFKKVKTTVKPEETPTQLVKFGPFSLSRHPMYLGMLTLLWGVAIVLGSVAALTGPMTFWAILQFVFIPHEERVMRAEFGEEYADYVGKVRMWI